MLSLACRKATVNKATGRVFFLGLPDDILILILSQCRIDELVALRLTNSNLRDCITEYISTIAPSVARSTFPYSDLLLTHDGTKYTFEWLLGLIPRQLAAILVDRHRLVDEPRRLGIPAEDRFGDEMRARVTSGWHTLRRLSNISREVYTTRTNVALKSPAEIAYKLVHPARFKLESLQQKEDLILQRRLEYFNNLPIQTASDYKLMMVQLSAIFNTSISNVGSAHEPWVFDWGGGLDGQRSFRKGESWLAWLVLAEGPDMFWRQWWSLPHESAQNHIRDRAIQAFHDTPTALVDYQRSLAHKFQKAVNEKVASEAGFEDSSGYGYFANFAECRLQQERASIPPAQEIMEHVPFHVNFRCPDALIKRSEFLLEGVEASRASRALVSRET